MISNVTDLFFGMIAGLLVLAKRDRLARDVRLAGAIEALATEKGARVVSADGSGNGNDPESVLLRQMQDVIAQYERARIRLRILAAMQVKKARGERASGWLPYGKTLADDGRSLVSCPREAEVVALALELSREATPGRPSS